MKALKMKNSPDENPIWGRIREPMYIPQRCKMPEIVLDFWTNDILMDNTANGAAASKWEFVNIDVKINRQNENILQ